MESNKHERVLLTELTRTSTFLQPVEEDVLDLQSDPDTDLEDTQGKVNHYSFRFDFLRSLLDRLISSHPEWILWLLQMLFHSLDTLILKLVPV